MTQRGTGYQNLTVRFLAAQFNIGIQILPLPDRSVHDVYVTDYSNDE